MIRPFLIALALAVPASGNNEVSPDGCPPFGSARCPDQGDCGAHPSHNLAYDLRVGHADYDPASGLLYNPGRHGDDWKKWEYFAAPSFKDRDAWCHEFCGEGDPDEPCVPRPRRVGPPAKRPLHPRVVRCFMGESGGGIDWTQYMACGAPEKSTSTAAGAAAGPGAADAECTLGDSRCVCVKGVPLYEKYERAAAGAVSEAFARGARKPANISDAEATARVCRAYNANPTLGRGTRCRPSDNEIVLEDPRPPIPGFVTVAVGIVKPNGDFGSRAVAACQRGAQ